MELGTEARLYLKKKLVNISDKSVQVVLDLHADGGTVPFIARYRKEKTGNLDEVQIRDVLEGYETFQEVVKRKSFILQEIGKQGNLTTELKSQIEGSWSLDELEEYYRPYKKKKKTKATLAKEAGLEPLSDWIWELGQGDRPENKITLEVKAKEFISPARGFATYDEVLRGAQHILVEKISNVMELREFVKKEYFENGKVVSEKSTKFKPHSKFEMYAAFSESVKKIQASRASHRYLALRRGWNEEELKVSIEVNDDLLLNKYTSFANKEPGTLASAFLEGSAKSALTVHVIPSVVNELHRKLKESADTDAIFVFSENVRRVLMGSPFGSRVVLGVDPGLKSGCKIALIDEKGQYISNTVMHILGESAEKKAEKLFSEVVRQIEIKAVAVGNGTGGREAETFIRKVLKKLEKDVPVVMISESGASVYSASNVAREEFPDLDLTVRGAISIARRLQDPLSELVKIDPKSIGVGQYQHDVVQTKLKKSLHSVVESCVNQVGVDINTSSPSLLQYVSGIGPAIAKNIVEYRTKNGLFKNRSSYLQIPRFSEKVFEQAAGFLRISNGEFVLDNSGIHPERYSALRDMVKEVGKSIPEILGEGAQHLESLSEKWSDVIGEYTFKDIIQELKKPGRDPRDPYKVFQYRDDIHGIKDLKEGMICPGLVSNITNFGAFVDIGVHQDGLVHISHISHDFVDDPRKVISPGDIVKVKVLAVDKEKNQISLTMNLEPKPEVKAKRPSARKAKGGASAAAGRGDGKGKSSFKGKRKPGDKSRPPRVERKKQAPFNNPFASLGLKK